MHHPTFLQFLENFQIKILVEVLKIGVWATIWSFELNFLPQNQFFKFGNRGLIPENMLKEEAIHCPIYKILPELVLKGTP